MARLWTDSIKDMFLFVCGAQTTQAYSKMGLINDV